MGLFTDHPKSIGQSYGGHARGAGRIGATMVLAGLACLVHAVFPFLFEKTAGKAIDDLKEEADRIRFGTEPKKP